MDYPFPSGSNLVRAIFSFFSAIGDDVPTIHVQLPGARDIAGYLSGGEAPIGGAVEITALHRGEQVGRVRVKAGSFVISSLPEGEVDLLFTYLDARGQVRGGNELRSVRVGQHDLRVPEWSK